MIILVIILLFSFIVPGLFSPGINHSIALLMAVPVSFLEKILKPFSTWQGSFSSEQKKRSSLWPVSTRDDISAGTEQGPDNLNEEEKILEGIMNFGYTNVSAIMCPRIDVTAINIRAEFEQVIKVIIKSGFSRIPVYADTFDNIKGILYAKDILPYMSNPRDFKWQSLLREPYFVPESKRINDLLKEFQVKKFHMAVVIDEYGGTAGIATLEDILEEIVGEITDESDEEEVPYRKIDENIYVFEGKILLNDIIKILNLNSDPFEEVRGEAETLAGLILEITGEIPEQNQTISYRDFIFNIESADRRRIKEVRVEIVSDDEKSGEK
jgi:gliding motility-associated protein GldE